MAGGPGSLVPAACVQREASTGSGDGGTAPAEAGASLRGAGAAEGTTATKSPKSPRMGPQRDPGVVQGLTRQADLLASRGRYAEALPLVDEALRLEPQRADLHHGRGQCLAHLERSDEAAAAFEEAIRLEPGHKAAIKSKAAVRSKQQRWVDAAACLREALAMDAANLELRTELARCLTEQGVQLKVAGRPEPQLFHDALQVSELYAPAHFQLGVEHSEASRPAQAKECYTRAVQLHPGYVEAWNNLGVACRILGEPEHSVEACNMALKVNMNCSKTRENMAIALLELGCRRLQQKEMKKASALLKQALTYNSKNADIYFNLGVMYAEQQKWDRAKANYELAAHFDPSHINTHNNLGVIHRRQGNHDAAVVCFQQALEVDPKMNLASKNLGAVFGAMGRMAESIQLTKHALEASPKDAEAYNNLALLYRDQCDLGTCLEHLDTCLSLEPENQHACSNRLMSLNYQSELSRDEVYEAHRSWGEQLERRIPVQYSTWTASGSSSGPLRIAYISPDFYAHSVSYFIHAALRYHDPAYVSVTCYSDVAMEDEKTRLFRSFVPRWRNTLGLSDEEVARLIHDDGIDILVELTGHTGSNRLPALARRPAPVIVTWIGYPHTTGLSRVDYRISDEHADPSDLPGLTTEKLVYLPECFLCYTPPDNAPQVSLRPAQEAYGCITFGCFNNLAKVSTLTVRLWSSLLREVPDARLFLKSKALRCPHVQEKLRKSFAAYGIEACRLDLSGLQPQTGNHLQMYGLVDVALDTVPYAGTTTTCEALYMGIPVVTLRGRGIHAQNVGVSLLTAVQLGDLVADTEEDFVQKATSLARNPTRLAALRAGLRTRMLRSVLCDGPRHAARLERLYGRIAAGEPGAAVAAASGARGGAALEEAAAAEVQ